MYLRKRCLSILESADKLDDKLGNNQLKILKEIENDNTISITNLSKAL